MSSNRFLRTKEMRIS